MFSHSKGNAVLVFLTSIAFIALCGAAMWFLSDITPLSMEPTETQPPLVVGEGKDANVFTGTPTPDDYVAEVPHENETSSRDEIAAFLAPTINPLSGVYINPFE